MVMVVVLVLVVVVVRVAEMVVVVMVVVVVIVEMVMEMVVEMVVVEVAVVAVVVGCMFELPQKASCGHCSHSTVASSDPCRTALTSSCTQVASVRCSELSVARRAGSCERLSSWRAQSLRLTWWSSATPASSALGWTSLQSTVLP